MVNAVNSDQNGRRELLIVFVNTTDSPTSNHVNWVITTWLVVFYGQLHLILKTQCVKVKGNPSHLSAEGMEAWNG